MRRNLDALGGFLLSERVMFALADKIGKQTAHEVVYEASMQGFEQGHHLRACAYGEPARQRRRSQATSCGRCSTRRPMSGLPPPSSTASSTRPAHQAGSRDSDRASPKSQLLHAPGEPCRTRSQTPHLALQPSADRPPRSALTSRFNHGQAMNDARPISLRWSTAMLDGKAFQRIFRTTRMPILRATRRSLACSIPPRCSRPWRRSRTSSGRSFANASSTG